MDVVPSESLNISDRALLPRFGQVKSVQRSTGCVEGSSSVCSASGLRVDGHPLNLSMDIFDRALLRRFPDVPLTLSSTSGSAAVIPSPSRRVTGETTKKRKRFIGKGNTNKAFTSPESLESLQKQVQSPVVLSSSLSSPSVPDTVPSGFALLYYTLVKDNALPIGYLQQFLSLEIPACRAAKRSKVSAALISDSMASTALSELRKKDVQRAAQVISISDQVVIAADLKPRRFRTKWQRAFYDGPTARKDAELAERDRWVQLLANLLRSTDTPMGRLIRENPSNVQLLGGGRRAGTLRSRVRSIQKFIEWLVAAHQVSFSNHWRQLTEYLQVRYSEPCVRGALKLVHSSYIFLQEVAGIEDKLTDSAMYTASLKELHGSSEPRNGATGGSKVFQTNLLAAMEDMVLSVDTPLFMKVLSWWLLVQSWGTLRFDDHRGLLPCVFKVSETGLLVELSRSKVSGPDKRLSFRVVVFHSLRPAYST